MALAWGWYLLLVVAFFILGGLGIWLLIEVFREKKEPEDKTIALNWCSHLSGGRFLGTEDDVKLGKGNRFFIHIDPKDISVNHKGEIKLQPVIVDVNKRVTSSRGFPSKDRNIAFYLPPNPEDFPDSFKETALGKAFMWLTELKNYEKTVIDIVREGSSRKDELLKKIGDGEISKEFIQFQEGLVADYLKKIINPKEAKEKSSSINLSDSSK